MQKMLEEKQEKRKVEENKEKTSASHGSEVTPKS